MLPKLEKLKRLLLKDWDPIGIADVPEATEEYDSYAFHLFVMVNEGADVFAIAGYLNRVATEHIGLSGDPDRDHRIAEQAIAIVRDPKGPSLRSG